jgi:hypothetical protein
MAVTINWATKEINISRAGLTLVQSNPSEIRQLNLNEFRLDLKDLEDDEEGIVFPRTHNHNTEVFLGGIVYARTIEIINNYTITFEDGQYAVNLVGANSNVGDVVNLNQVSIRSSNAAGLISNSAIEFSSFNGGITVDITNSSGFAKSGTVFPIGTRQVPSNNLSDAYLIASRRGLTKIFVLGDLTITNAASWFGYKFEGESPLKSSINILTDANVENCEFYNATISGTLDSNSQIEDSTISGLDFVDGQIFNCQLGPQEITLGTSTIANIFSSFSSVPGSLTPVIDMNVTGILGLRNYNGGVLLKNYSGTGSHSIDLAAGQVKLDPETITSGEFIVRGIGKLIDSVTGEHIKTGIWNTGVTIRNELINQVTIGEASAYTDGVYVDTVNGVSGSLEPTGLKRQPSNNLADALIISVERGTKKLIFLSDFTFQSTDVVVGYELSANGFQNETLTFIGGTVVAYCTVTNATLTGNFTGIVGMTDCYLKDLGSIGLTPSSNDLVLTRCKLGGTSTLPDNYSGNITINSCYSDNGPDGFTTFDGGDSSATILFNNWSGFMKLSNISKNNRVDIRMSHGDIILNDSVTSATINVIGSGYLRDALGNEIPSGVWKVGVSISNELQSGNLTTNQSVQLDELYKLQGLDVDTPLTVTQTTRTFGAVTQSISTTGENNSQETTIIRT